MTMERGISDMLGRLAALEREVERLRTVEVPGALGYGFQANGTVLSPTTTSTGFVMTDVRASITKRRSETVLFAVAMADCFNSIAGNDVYIGMAVNGVTGVVASNPVRSPSSSILSNTIGYVFTGIPAGAQRVDMYWHVDIGTGTLYSTSRWIWVMEGYHQ